MICSIRSTCIYVLLLLLALWYWTRSSGHHEHNITGHGFKAAVMQDGDEQPKRVRYADGTYGDFSFRQRLR